MRVELTGTGQNVGAGRGRRAWSGSPSLSYVGSARSLQAPTAPTPQPPGLQRLVFPSRPGSSGKGPDPKGEPLDGAGPWPGAAASSLSACTTLGKRPPQSPDPKPTFRLIPRPPAPGRPFCSAWPWPVHLHPLVPTASPPPCSTQEEMGHWARLPPALQEQAALAGAGPCQWALAESAL